MKQRIESQGQDWGRGRNKLPDRATKWKKTQKNEEGLRELQDNMKRNNICIIVILEREDEDQGIENLFEKVMSENFLNLMGEKVT